MQCRRSYLPEVADVADFATVAGLPGAVLADAGGGPPTLARPVVLVGPEGGWSDDERASRPAPVGLGDHVLRAETAAITAAALLTALRAGRVQHAELLHSPEVST
jgi:RsmE family RNA methyltransferase